MDDGLREKIALFCDVEKRAVVPMVTAPVLYEVPLLLEQAGVADYVMQRLGLSARAQSRIGANGSSWSSGCASPNPRVQIALVGKYVELHDAYMSVREALKHAALHLGVELDIHWVHSAELEKGKGWDLVRSAVRGAGAGRVWQPRDRRQDPGGSLCPDRKSPLPGPVPGDAVDGGRVWPRCAGHG